MALDRWVKTVLNAKAAALAKMEKQQQEEIQRVINYDLHQKLISEARNISFEELHCRIKELPALRNPIPYYEDSNKQGIPRDGDQTLFQSILINEKLTIENKLFLLKILLLNKTGAYQDSYFYSDEGYKQFADLVFKSPIIDILMQPLNATQILYPLLTSGEFVAPAKEIENQSWLAIIHTDLTKASQIFKYLSDTNRSENRIIKFIEIWRSVYNPITDEAFNNFFIDLLKLPRNENLALDQALENHILEITRNNISGLIDLYAKANLTNKLMNFFTQWARSNYAVHTAQYIESYLALVKYGNRVALAPNIWSKITATDDTAAERLFAELGNIVNDTGLIKFLICWANNSQNLTKAHTSIFNYYINVIKNSIEAKMVTVADEESIWAALINTDRSKGTILCHHLLIVGAGLKKMLDFTKCWMNQLTNPMDIHLAFSKMKDNSIIGKSTLQKFLPFLKEIGQIRINSLRKQGVLADKNHQHIIKNFMHTDNSFFSCGSNNVTPLKVYNMIDKNKPRADAFFKTEMKTLEEKINNQLRRDDCRALTFSH